MKLTPLQRRERLQRMADNDPEIRRMMEECEKGRAWFEKATRWMPPALHSKWWNFPGMGYLLHGRMLTLICENMRFCDEESENCENLPCQKS